MAPSINPNATDNVIDPNSSYGKFLAQQFGGEADPNWFKDIPDPDPKPDPPDDPFTGVNMWFEKDGKWWGPSPIKFTPRIPE